MLLNVGFPGRGVGTVWTFRVGEPPDWVITAPVGKVMPREQPKAPTGPVKAINSLTLSGWGVLVCFLSKGVGVE
jgi:hypothetical protein